MRGSVSTVFNPERILPKINWEAIDVETKDKWNRAREIINADDKGSWGANFFAHSEEIQRIFPELETAREVFESQFKRIIRLMKFVDKKSHESQGDKRIHVLAFGHENYLGYALNQYFGENEIGNCEALNIEVQDGQAIMERRGNKKLIE